MVFKLYNVGDLYQGLPFNHFLQQLPISRSSLSVIIRFPHPIYLPFNGFIDFLATYCEKFSFFGVSLEIKSVLVGKIHTFAILVEFCYISVIFRLDNVFLTPGSQKKREFLYIYISFGSLAHVVVPVGVCTCLIKANVRNSPYPVKEVTYSLKQIKLSYWSSCAHHFS